MGSQKCVFVGLYLSSKTKVRKLNLIILRKEDVGRFEIPMDNIFAVECNHSISYLLKKLLRFKFRKCTPCFQVILEVTALANLKDEVVRIFRPLVAIELDDVPVLDSVQHGDLLAEELLHIMLSNLSYINLLHSHWYLFKFRSWTALIDAVSL